MPLRYERVKTKVGFGTLSPAITTKSADSADDTTNPDDQGGGTVIPNE